VTAPERPPYGWAAAAFGAVMALYVATLAPTTAFWDTSEYIAAAKVLGIPHPPGNPLFTLTAHVFGLLPIASEYAKRINLYAAFTSAVAFGCWFLVAEAWLRSIVPHRPVRLATAFAGVLVGAAMWTTWNQSTVNEKVYTFSLLSIALCTWWAVRWGQYADAGIRRDRLLVAIAYLLGLTWTNHTMGLLAAPAIGIFVLLTDWRVLFRVRTLAASAAVALIGVTPNYVYMPMRAGQYPPINEGEPVGFFSRALMDNLNRAQYGKPSVFERQADFASQLGNYWQYWSWQFARDWGAFGPVATAIFTVLGAYGLMRLFRSDRRAAWTAATLLFTLTIALIFYLNFKYGFSMHPEQRELPREVRERDYFFVGSFSAFAIFAAAGFAALLADLATWLGRRDGTPRWTAATPVLGLALIPLLGNSVTAPRSGETIARDFARDILESVEPYGILITAGDNDTFPLWYAQEVEGIRRDVLLANLSLMNTRWHLRQLRRRPVEPFDPAKSVPLWGGDKAGAATTWKQPEGPALPFTVDQLDSLPEVMRAPKNSGIVVDSVQMILGSEILQLQDLATIALIKENLGKRPIFFSWSDGGYPDQMLGLSPYLVSQGLVRKLSPVPVTPNDSIVINPTVGLMDLPRTRELLERTYRWQAAAMDRPRGWMDPPSSSILELYNIVYRALGQTLSQQGDVAGAAKADSISAAITRQVRR
jgi:hypothetical protein